MSSDDDDLREDLLQVAGGRTSAKKRGRGSHSVSEEPSISEEALEDSDEDGDYGASRSSRKPARKRLATAASDSEDDLETDGFDDGYASDLMGDEEDRAQLAAMTELDREMILSDRAEARENAQQRAENARLIQQQQRQQTAKKATRSSRVSTRAKKPDQAKKSAMEELKAARVRKAQPRSAARDADWEGESPDVSGDEAAARDRQRQSASVSEEEELRERSPALEYDEGDADIERRHQEDDMLEEAAWGDVDGIVVRRHKLEAWVSKPFFATLLPGAFVRMGMGMRTNSQGVKVPHYLLAQIDEVEERSEPRIRDPNGRPWENPYQLFGSARSGTPTKPNQTRRTNKWLRVRRGDSVRLMPVAMASDSGGTEEEFANWQAEQAKYERPPLTNADVVQVRENLVKAAAYKFTAEDVRKMVEEKRARGAFGRNTAAERARLSRDYQHALETSDLEEAARLKQILEALEQRAAEDAERAKGISMAEVNRKNKAVNFQNAFKDVSARPEGSRVDSSGVDMFSRRKTVSRNYWATGGRTTGTEEAAAGSTLPSIDTVAAAAAADDNELETPAAHVHQDEATGAVELDIDLSVLSLPRRPPLAAKLLGPDWRSSLRTIAVPPDIASRPKLSLAEYRQRQAMADAQA